MSASGLRSASSTVRPDPWRRAIAWPIPPAPISTTISLLIWCVLVSGRVDWWITPAAAAAGVGWVRVGSVHDDRLGRGGGVRLVRRPVLAPAAVQQGSADGRTGGQQGCGYPERGGVAVGAGLRNELRCAGTAGQGISH